jgi:hypothetical protein
MVNSVSINTQAIEEWFKKTADWVKNFFETIDQEESLAVGAIGLGVILLILGIILI